MFFLFMSVEGKQLISEDEYDVYERGDFMSRRSAIHSLADDIISVLAINQFPVNMELLIRELGGQLQYGDMKENYSCIIKKVNHE